MVFPYPSLDCSIQFPGKTRNHVSEMFTVPASDIVKGSMEEIWLWAKSNLADGRSADQRSHGWSRSQTYFGSIPSCRWTNCSKIRFIFFLPRHNLKERSTSNTKASVKFGSCRMPLLAQKSVFKLAFCLEPNSNWGKVAAWQPRARKMESLGMIKGSSKRKGLGFLGRCCWLEQQQKKTSTTPNVFDMT